MDLLYILSQKNIIAQSDIEIIRREAEESGKKLEEVLVSRGITQADILNAKSDFIGIPSREIGNSVISFDILKYIPEKSAEHYKIVPIGITDGVLEVGAVDPDNIEMNDALQFISTNINMPYKLFLVSEEDFENILKSYKGLTGEVSKALNDLETELSVDETQTKKEEESKTNQSQDSAMKIVEDAPVTKIVANILRYAMEARASDIHIEPVNEMVRVRFRVDGDLHESLTLPIKVHSSVVARIKILANMKLDEKRKPQDGRFPAHIDGRQIDFRVSTFPTYYGEKVVMRLLDSSRGVIALDKMGLSQRNYNAIMRAIDRPYGMILISGPTGSGKTTTLYSMLQTVDRQTKNVLSLEDPVEYQVDGVSQSQIQPEIGYTFATGLRTTLRQDPDIIMVGEIRDKETAQLAVQAALTGHLVLSTIHTNNSLGVIPRLIDMGVDPYLIAPTLILAIAQRLTQTLCPGTGKAVPIDGSIKAIIDEQFKTVDPQFRSEIPLSNFVYEPEPTPECPRGLKGRSAVFEILEMNRDLENTILKDPTEPALMAIARKQGMFTMREDALIKSMQKIVPFEEALKL